MFTYLLPLLALSWHLASSAPNNPAPPGLQIEQAVIVSRHSLRWLLDAKEEALQPLLRDSSDDAIRTVGEFGVGRLTRLGRETAKQVLGAELRRRYVDELHLLSPKLHGDAGAPAKLGLRSSRVPRCTESLIYVLSGLYPGTRALPLFADDDKSFDAQLVEGKLHPFVRELGKAETHRDWSFLDRLPGDTWKEADKDMLRELAKEFKKGDKILPIQVRSRRAETLMANKKSPGTSELMTAAKTKALGNLQAELAAVNAPLEKYVSRETVSSMRGPSLRTFLEVTQAHKLAFQPGIDATKVRDANAKVEEQMYKTMFEDATWRKNGPGRWLDEVLSTFEAKIANHKDVPLLSMGWGHDVSLVMIMPYFGGLQSGWPDFNDHLAIELWRTSSSAGHRLSESIKFKRYVRLRYNQHYLELPACADTDPRQKDKTLHPWEQFLKVYGPQRTVG